VLRASAEPDLSRRIGRRPGCAGASIPAPIDPARPEDGNRDISREGFTSYDEADAELTVLRADLIRTVPQSVGADAA
jgi:hypothetical protein